MNFIRAVLSNDLYNISSLQQMTKENNEDLILLHDNLIDKLGYDIHDEVIIQVALKRLLECYTTDEIIEVLNHFKQLKEG